MFDVLLLIHRLRLQDLNDAGHVQTVKLAKHASNHEIKHAVIEAFSGNPDLAQVSDPGWHLLKVFLQGAGRTSLLKPVAQGDMNKVTFTDWEKCVVDHLIPTRSTR